MIFGKERKVYGEMTYPCRKEDSYGMWIEINSGDHNPPHAHVYNTDFELVGKLIIGPKPNSKDDVESVKGFELSNEFKKKIFKWSKASDADGVNNWIGLRRDWRTSRPK